MDSIKMIIVLILLLSINGLSCLKNGKALISLPAYANSIVTIWQYESTTPQYRCSGNIITRRHVVTAGHCLHDVRNYEIYVTAGRIDLDDTISMMVHKIYLHHNLIKVNNVIEPYAEYWLNDIAVLDLVLELTWSLHIAPMSLSFRRWIQAVSHKCYIMGYNYNPINTTPSSTILQWADASILGNHCSQTNSFLLPNEIHAIITTVPAELDDTDIGNSLICNKVAIGIIVRGGGPTRSLITVLPFAPYQSFIEYITAGGAIQIEERELRYAVSIWVYGNFRCGGFTVHNHYVVTAAHCVKGVERNHLAVASSNLLNARIDPSSKWSLVESIEIHQLYPVFDNENSREHSAENDIAVIKLKSALPWNPLFRLGDLPDPNQISVDKPCEILRWTPPLVGETGLKILKKSFVRILTDRENEESGAHLGAEQFRAKGFYALPFANTEDIGNPIIFENNIIGMVVAIDSIIMDKTEPVTCLKIRPYEAFIRRIINDTNL